MPVGAVLNVASQNYTAFQWTKRKEVAARLLAADELPDEKIAEGCRCSRRTLASWKNHPEFSERVAQHVEEWRKRIMSRGIADRTRRVAALDDRWNRMQRVIAERSEDPELQEIPGGKTGLLCRQLKSVGFGENNQIVEEYAVDTGLLKELRAHEQQAAQELGQWTEKREIAGVGDVPAFVVEVVTDGDPPDAPTE